MDMNFMPRRVREALQGEPLSDRLSGLLDHAIAEKAKAEYAAGRGSGAGDVAKHRIGSGYIGAECDRALANRYHHIPKDPDADTRSVVNKGELNRHAQMGHWFEERMADWLRLSGFVVATHNPETGKQYGYKAAWDPDAQQYRMAGEVDGIIHSVPAAFPDIPVPCIWESKKSTNKKFNKFSNEGVQKADGLYYGQLQTNMAYMGIGASLFTMMNCDNMKIYSEVVLFNPAHAQKLSDRAVRVIQSRGPEEFARIGKDATDFRCKFCDWRDGCWAQKAAESTNAAAARGLPFQAPDWMKSAK